MTDFYVERALFVVGEQNSGKSNQLRSLLRDRRMGQGGVVRRKVKIPEVYRLSNERSLYLRLTSPHETGESLPEFLEGLWDKFSDNTSVRGRRWNAACALQPFRANSMRASLPTICKTFISWFAPERMRVAFLSPDRNGNLLQDKHEAMAAILSAIPGVEVCWIDARDRTANGLLLADFFDFT